MSFLDKPVSELSLAELRRLISTEVSAQIPAIPTGVLGLDDGDVPLVPPDHASTGQVLMYQGATNTYIPTDLTGVGPGTTTAVGTPTVQGVIDAIAVSWTAVTSSAPVFYNIYMSQNSGFTTYDATTYIATTATNLVFIHSDATGADLTYDTTLPYYIKVIAVAGGVAAAASPQSVAVNPSQVTGPDIITNAIITRHITAGNITSETLNTALVLSGVLATAATGARVEVVGGQIAGTSGISLYSSDGVTKTVFIPTASTDTASFSGNVTTGGLVVTGNAVFQGNSSLDRASVLTALEKLSDPSNAPIIANNYPLTQMEEIYTFPTISTLHKGYHISNASGTYKWYGLSEYQNISTGKYTTYLTIRTAAGAFDSDTALKAGVLDGNRFFPIGAVAIGAKIYAFYWIQSTNHLGVKVYDLTPTTAVTTDLGASSATLVPATSIQYGCTGIGLGSDGTNPYIFSFNSSTKVICRHKVDISTPTVPVLNASTDFTGGIKISSVGDAQNPGTNGNAATSIGGAGWDGTYWMISGAYTWGSGAHKGTLFQQYNQATSAVRAKHEVYLPSSDSRFSEIGSTTSTQTMSSGVVYNGSDGQWYCTSTENIMSGLGGTGSGGGACVRKLNYGNYWDYTLGTNYWIAYSWIKDNTFGTATISNATPAVVTATAHGCSTGDEIYFTTTGSLPSPLVANTAYYVSTTTPTADTFKISTTRANAVAGTNIATSSAGSPTHTLHIIDETLVSPRSSFSTASEITAAPLMLGTINISAAPIPSAADKMRTYGVVKTAAPATTDMRRFTP